MRGRGPPGDAKKPVKDRHYRPVVCPAGGPYLNHFLRYLKVREGFSSMTSIFVKR
jgi:hypothetical protein